MTFQRSAGLANVGRVARRAPRRFIGAFIRSTLRAERRARPTLFLALVLVALTVSASAKEFLVYFGTYTGGLSKGIYVSRLAVETGELSAPELAAATPSPCFLAISPGQRFLYSADSVANFHGENSGAVSAFAINRNSGQLTFLNQKSSGGSGPCYVSVDATGEVLLAANYGAGSVKSFKLNRDGSIGDDGSCVQHRGTGANTNRQSAPHAHFIQPDPSNRFALACDLGADQVVIYGMDLATGTLTEHSSMSVPAGSGARHLAFSRDGKFAYVVNEMGCTVTAFSWNSVAGTLTPIETVSVLPPGVTVQTAYTGAEILTAGKCVYATVRGYDGVIALTADAASGRLAFLQNIPAGGKVPRGLGIDPTGRWLIVGNQKTDNAVEFGIDPATGRLSATGRELKIGSPVDVKFVESR